LSELTAKTRVLNVADKLIIDNITGDAAIIRFLTCIAVMPARRELIATCVMTSNLQTKKHTTAVALRVFFQLSYGMLNMAHKITGQTAE
jgi:hypothetical protein